MHSNTEVVVARLGEEGTSARSLSTMSKADSVEGK